MPDPIDLTLGVLFKAREDANFKRITRRLHTIVTGFQQGMHKVDVAAKKVEQSLKRIEGASRRAERGLRSTGKAADFTGRQIGKVHGGIQRLIAAFKVVAVYTVAGRLFGGLQEGLRSSFTEIINFDQALANLKAITGATSGEIAAMRDILTTTAIRTKYSTTELAEGMVLLGQAGFDAGESIKAIEAVADLAAGTLSDLRTVSDLVTTTIRAFNLEAGETRRVADVMANAINKSKLTVDKLRIAFNYVGAGAHQAGVTLEQTGQAMMLLANNGMRASTIGTGLRQVLSRMLSPNAKLRDAMLSYGLEIDKASGKTEWFGDQIGKLATIMWDYEKQTVNMSRAYELFGLRGAQSAAILVSSYMDANGVWEDTLRKVNDVGTALRMMEEQSKGLAFKIKNLSDIFKTFALELGDAGVTGAMKVAVDLLRYFGMALVWLAGKPLGQAIFLTGAFATVLFTLKLAFVAVQGAMSASGFGLLKFFLNPVGLVIVAVSVLVGGLVALVNWLKRERAELDKTAAKTKSLITSLRGYQNQLNDVQEGSVEYTMIVERLRQSHSELSDKIDDAAGSYEKLSKAMDEAINATKLEALKTAVRQLEVGFGPIDRLSLMWQKFPKEVGEKWETFTDYIRSAMKEQPGLFKVNEEAVESLSARLRDLFTKGGGKSFVEVDELLKSWIEEFGKSEEWAHTFPILLEKIHKRLKEMYADQLSAQARIQEQQGELVSNMSDEWQEAYRKMGDLQKLEVLSALRKARSGWGTLSKELETQVRTMDEHRKKSEDEWREYKENLQKKYFAKELEAFFKKEDDKLDKAKSTIKEVQDYYTETFGNEFDKAFYSMDNFYKELAKNVQESTDSEKSKSKQLLDMWEAYYARLQELIDEYGENAGLLYTDKQVAERLSAVAAAGGIPSVGGRMGTTPDTEQDRMTPAEYKKWQTEGLEEGYKDEKKLAKKAAQERMAIAEEAYRAGEMSAEDYFAALKEMEEQGLIDWKEYQEKMRREQQSTWENFKEGWRKFFREMETHGEFMYRIGQELPEMMANNFADAFGDFVTGTKTAKEAFRDMARDMLRWIAEIAAKRAMLGMLGMATGGGGGSEPYIGAVHGGGIYPEHSGLRKLKGMHFAPKLHSGLAPDEFAAILKKDEGVFTKKQMQALGMMANGGTQISVPVNVNGQSNDSLQRHLPGEIEEAVLKTMRRYM